MFYPLKVDSGSGVLPYEMKPAAAGTYKAGTMLTFSSGKLIPASKVTAAPEYVSVGNETVTDGALLTVAACSSNVTWRCNDVAGTPAVGDKVGIVNGVQASTSETNKCATVTAVREDGSIEVRF